MPTFLRDQCKRNLFNVEQMKAIGVTDNSVMCRFQGDDRAILLGTYNTEAEAMNVLDLIVGWMDGDGCEFPYESMEFVFEMPEARKVLF